MVNAASPSSFAPASRRRAPQLLAKGTVVALLLTISAIVTRAANSPELTAAKFAPPSTNAGGTLFTRMDPSATGVVVQNLYDDPQMWGARYRAFMGGAMGSGMAAGDFDGDGKVDLYVSTKTKPGRLFRNLGGWKFVDVTKEAGLSDEGSLLGWVKSAVSSDKVVWNQGAVFADVNNDGRLDLFVCRNNAPNLLYINNGDGTFTEEAAKRGLAMVDGSVVGAFADYDRDGWLDVLILTNQVDGTEPFGRPDRLFHNDGNGYFTEVTSKSGISGDTFGHAATWFDYDSDGWPDLYITNDFSGSDRLYRNNHNGTFTNVLDATVPHTPYSSMGADVADVNNDGNFDLFVADMATTTREKDRRGLAASRDDVLTAGTKKNVAPQYTRNALLLNTGRGLFQEAACWAGIQATDWTWSPRFEDFDNDGWVDLHVTNGMVREANNSDVLVKMMRALSDAERIRVMKQSPELREANLAYRNLRGLGFEPVSKEWGLDEVGVSFGSVTADFDNDGDLDLAYLNYDGGVSLFRNDITGRHRFQVRLHGTRSNRFGIGAAVRIESKTVGRQAREMTVARGYASGSEAVAHFGLGPDEKVSRLEVEWPSGIRQEFTDLDADQAYLVTENGSVSKTTGPTPQPLFDAETARRGLALNDDSPLAVPDKEQAFLPFRTDRRGPAVAVADIDGDGREDIYVGATTGSPARLLRRKGDGYAPEAPNGIPRTSVEDGPVLLLDLDGNGTRDLLITKASANLAEWPQGFQPTLYANDGKGNFSATDRLPSLHLNVGAACAADIDGDGDLDLFLGARSVPGHYPETPTSVLLRNDHGHFVDVTGDSPGLGKIGLVKSALFRDIDGDGHADLIVALEWDYVRVFHNDGRGRFSDWTQRLGFESGGRGWWNGLAAADFNGDGRPDFAVGNLGLNTPYHASREQPALLYDGDFAHNGTKVLVEGVYDGSAIYPLRARGDLGTQLPFVLRKFPKNDDFAKATLAQVFGEETLRTADVFRADNFSSGVFLSQPDGTYRFAAFPRAAQIGPMQGIVAADLDGDGKVDVCAVQNTDIATPHFDGGVGILLKGHGDGTFESIAPAQSGVVVPGNGRGLVIADLGAPARPDLFITRQSGPTEFLANQTAETNWLEVKLEGTPGNPDAIGARIKLVFSDGPALTDEIGLGGGWLSQSVPAVFVGTSANRHVSEAVVTWPNGQVSHHRNAPPHGRWTLRMPANPQLKP